MGDEEIATFYDPDDPRRDLAIAFESFRQDTQKPYLHIGVSYCWPSACDSVNNDSSEEGPTRKTGHLVVVKNRLPSSFKGEPVRPLLTEEDIVTEGEYGCDNCTSDDDEWNDMRMADLGPYGCCDCCHKRNLNCGPKFPHGTFTGYLYLSPQWFNSLCRLGYYLSGEAVQAINRDAPLSQQWEEQVRTTPRVTGYMSQPRASTV